jgi:peptidoglycan/LPS O-acetylase OafA/YrhL
LFVGWFHFAYPVLGGYLLLWIASVKIPPSLDFTKLGDLSYEVYLYGYPIKLLIMSTVGVLINTYLLFIIATMISLIMAFGRWHLIGEPALQLARRMDSRIGRKSEQLASL